jgi:hypothetical protein
MVAFRTADTNYLSMQDLLNDKALVRELGEKVRWIWQQRHGIVSGEIPRSAMIKIVIDGKEVKP